MRNRVLLNIEVPLGIWIEDAIRVGRKLAKDLGVGIKFDFNGVTMIIYPDSDIGEEIRKYYSELKLKKGKKNRR